MVLSSILEWVASLLHYQVEPNHLAGAHDTKSIGDEVAVFRATHRSAEPARVDISCVLRLPDSRPPRFVLSIERYAGSDGDAPAEHCEVQCTGLAHEDGARLILRCAHVSISNALDEHARKKFYPCTWALAAMREWDGSIVLDLAAMSDRSLLPEWIFSPVVPRILRP